MLKRTLLMFGVVWTLFICIMAGTSKAADPELEILYGMDPAEAISEIATFKFYVEKDPNSTDKTFLFEISNDPVVTEWTGVVYDIPMGKTLDYYLESIDKEGDSEWSPSYPFKLRGHGVIINIKRVK